MGAISLGTTIQEWTDQNLCKITIEKFEVVFYADHTSSDFLNAVSHKVYIVDSRKLCHICSRICQNSRDHLSKVVVKFK